MAQGNTERVLVARTHRGERAVRATVPVLDVAGHPLARLPVCPPLLIAQTLAAQRASAPLPRRDRADLLAAAARIFLADSVGGFADYRDDVSAVSGHSRETADALCRAVAEVAATATERAYAARPVAAVESWRDAGHVAETGVWSRRGETLGAIVSGNSPTVHTAWLQALALGYRVAVRPSQGEPFTADRLVRALHEAGFRNTDVSFLPTDHAGADEIVTRADRALVYGGVAVSRKYGANPRVKVGGPGRSKTLVSLAPGQDRGPAVAAVADAVAAQSGTACVNTSAVLVDGDHRGFATELAAVLRTPRHRRSGPRVSQAAATALIGHLTARASDIEPLVPIEELAAPGHDGAVTLTPAVFVLDRLDTETLGSELPFPCVWVAPWRRGDGVAPLRDSLVVNAITSDETILDDLLEESSIANVHWNAPTTHSGTRMPHDGYVGEFLMTSKGFAANR
ncbi:aldehyde dehydrogenase family protein [Nocardia sp. NPDC050717]|uniref:aldehyde dehydrogenase family protein n=1 Tax=Nocardia sp. NPDC050717 TaxID=3157221 RepID=UPI0033F16411